MRKYCQASTDSEAVINFKFILHRYEPWSATINIHIKHMSLVNLTDYISKVYILLGLQYSQTVNICQLTQKNNHDISDYILSSVYLKVNCNGLFFYTKNEHPFA